MKKTTLNQTFFLFICLNMRHNAINAMQHYQIDNYQSDILKIRIVEQPYFCSIDTTKTVVPLKVVEDIKTKFYLCTLCPKKLISARGLSIHISRIHTKKPYKCSMCNKTFNDLANYMIHSQSHPKKITPSFPLQEKIRPTLLKNNYVLPAISYMPKYLPLENLPFESYIENNLFTSR